MNIKKSINFFNSEVDRYKKEYNSGSLKDFVRIDPLNFAWYGESYKEISRDRYYDIADGVVRVSLYRPYRGQFGDRKFLYVKHIIQPIRIRK